MAFYIKGLKLNFGIKKIMLSGRISKDGMHKCKVNPCRVCSLTVKSNSALSVQCCKWIHDRCDGLKIVIPQFSTDITYRKCVGNIEETVELEDMLLHTEEAVMELTYLGDRVSTVGRCEVAMTASTRCGWAKFRECDELLCGRRLPIELNVAVYESYLRTTILYGGEA